MLADVVESLMGAVFLDGGWNNLYKVFGRIVLPQIFYCCKYFDKMGTDLIHDIISFYATRGKSLPSPHFNRF
jgi:dsRNA-specific ribonuclease